MSVCPASEAADELRSDAALDRCGSRNVFSVCTSESDEADEVGSDRAPDDGCLVEHSSDSADVCPAVDAGPKVWRALCNIEADSADARSMCCDGIAAIDGDHSADSEAMGRKAEAYMSMGVEVGA